MKCENCKYWQDFSDRVIARISNTRGILSRGTIELRKCRNIPPPSVDVTFVPVYTDSEYGCSGFCPKESNIG